AVGAAELSILALHDALPISQPTVCTARRLSWVSTPTVTASTPCGALRSGYGSARSAMTLCLTARIDGSSQVSARRSLMKVLSARSEEHTSELQSRENLVCRL